MRITSDVFDVLWTEHQVLLSVATAASDSPFTWWLYTRHIRTLLKHVALFISCKNKSLIQNQAKRKWHNHRWQSLVTTKLTTEEAHSASAASTPSAAGTTETEQRQYWAYLDRRREDSAVTVESWYSADFKRRSHRRRRQRSRSGVCSSRQISSLTRQRVSAVSDVRCFFQLRQLRRIRRLLDDDTLVTFEHTLCNHK